jgi:peptide/nickel transport system permease protein
MSATTDTTVAASEVITTPEQTPVQIVLRRFRKHKLAMVSLVLITSIFMLSLLAPVVSPFKPDELEVGNYFLPFGAVNRDGRLHLMGTDNLGRDYFSRLVYAGRISLSVALICTLVSASVGIVIGAISGFYGGWLDAALMRTVEFLITLPQLPLLLILSSMFIRNENLIPVPDFVLTVVGKIMLLSPRDAKQAVMIIMVLAGLGWMGTSRLMRGMALSVREQTYVEASRALGASNLHIILGHIIPNALAPIIVDASLSLAGYVVGEASLSFLGFGIQDPIPTWGNMLSATQSFMLDKPWLPLVPGLPIFICSLAFNYIGDGLRDALDPRLKM